MSIAQISLAELLREHVTLEVESIDRMYLNVYIPKLQRESGASWFLKDQRQYPVASSAAMAPISRTFVAAIETYAKTHQKPFTAAERAAGYDYDISILQAEFALTQVLDRPQTGRLFFEAAIRENLDLGRPEQVQLIFERRIIRSTPSRFRTRIITAGVTPALHIDYKHSRIKQYHKEGRALRTETTINNTRDFQIGKRLKNLPALRLIGFQANRRLLHVQTLSHNCLLGEDAFQQVNQPQTVAGQRVAALRFTDPRVQALFSALVAFRLLPQGFANHELRALLAPLLGFAPDHFTQGQMTYHLRRLRLHGLIERIPQSHRYQVTDLGWRVAFFFTRLYARVLRPGLAQIVPQAPPTNHRLRLRFDQLDLAMKDWIAQANLTS
jgi:hypothetical protein